MNTGVYSITNKANGKKYIGSSSNLASRLRWHVSELTKGRHHSSKLLNAWNKHGAESFEVKVELVCGVDNLITYEQLLIDHYQSATKGYNVRVKAESNQGLRYPASTRKKMSEYASNRPEEHNEKIRRARTGVPLSETHRRNCSEAHKGLTYPNRKRGHKLGEEHRARLIEALTGRPVNADTRSRLREARPAGVTGEKGIAWDATRGKYSVAMRKNGKRTYVGRFDSMEEAKLARDKALQS